jgi:hypothetical protein
MSAAGCSTNRHAGPARSDRLSRSRYQSQPARDRSSFMSSLRTALLVISLWCSHQNVQQSGMWFPTYRTGRREPSTHSLYQPSTDAEPEAQASIPRRSSEPFRPCDLVRVTFRQPRNPLALSYRGKANNTRSPFPSRRLFSGRLRLRRVQLIRSRGLRFLHVNCVQQTWRKL